MTTSRSNKKVGYKLIALFALAMLLLPYTPIAAPVTANAQSGSRTFPETGKTVGGKFLQYWTQNGGLAQQGFPISAEMQEKSDTDGKTYVVQYFERAQFELHPELRAPNDVLLSLLGSFLYKQKYAAGAPGQAPNTAPGSQLFRETGKRVGGKFLDYWKKNGGLAQQGFPISEEFMERSALDGKTYRVQYFERAVFELHPEQRAPYDVLLSQLGAFRFKQKYTVGANPKPGDKDGDNIADADDVCPDEPENYDKVFDTDGCPDAGLQDLMDYAATDIDEFWAAEFAEADVEYAGPNELVGYNKEIATACGPAIPNNAFYCGDSHSIYYHIDFLQEQLDTDGDFAPVTILAHEWGHLVQANLDLLNSDLYTIQIELQADCFAGAWSKHADEAGLLEEGDLEEGATALYKAGDDIETPWFDPDAHGQPEERIEAYDLGFENGTDACFDEGALRLARSK